MRCFAWRRHCNPDKMKRPEKRNPLDEDGDWSPAYNVELLTYGRFKTDSEKDGGDKDVKWVKSKEIGEVEDVKAVVKGLKKLEQRVRELREILDERDDEDLFGEGEGEEEEEEDDDDDDDDENGR